MVDRGVVDFGFTTTRQIVAVLLKRHILNSLLGEQKI